MHCSPRQVRPLQVDWFDLARSIIYIALRARRVCDSGSRYRFVSVSFRRVVEGRGGILGARYSPLIQPARLTRRLVRARARHLEVVRPACRRFPDSAARCCRACIRGRAFKSPSRAAMLPNGYLLAFAFLCACEG